MKATFIMFIAAIATPGLSMRIARSSSSSTSTTSTAAILPGVHLHVSSASGGELDCAGLEAKQEYCLAQIEELKDQEVVVPAYLAGYASAAYDSLEMLGCSLKGTLKALV